MHYTEILFEIGQLVTVMPGAHIYKNEQNDNFIIEVNNEEQLGIIVARDSEFDITVSRDHYCVLLQQKLVLGWIPYYHLEQINNV